VWPSDSTDIDDAPTVDESSGEAETICSLGMTADADAGTVSVNCQSRRRCLVGVRRRRRSREMWRDRIASLITNIVQESVDHVAETSDMVFRTVHGMCNVCRRNTYVAECRFVDRITRICRGCAAAAYEELV